MWNIRSVYRSGSMKTVARELGKYKLDLVGVQEVRCEESGTERGDYYTPFLWRRELKLSVRSRFFTHKGIIPAVRRVDFVRDRITYTTIRGR
jgi:hypothetical protein